MALLICTHHTANNRTAPHVNLVRFSDFIELLFMTYDTYIARSHHNRLAFPPRNEQGEIVCENSAGSSQLGSMGGWGVFTGPMCQRRLGQKRGEKNLNLKLIKTNQQVKHCIWIKKCLFFVDANAIHNVPESGYNQIDVARIVFIFE